MIFQFYSDWLFFERWRIGDGWLDDREMARALPIFHDPVGIRARQLIFGDPSPF